MRHVAVILVAINVSCAGDSGGEPSVANDPSPTVEVLPWADVVELAEGTKGRVVVVDVWSTWCTPCLRELPHLVALANEHPDRVVAITVSLDFNGARGRTPVDSRERVLGVLRGIDARSTRNVISADADESVYETLGLAGVPAVLVYDTDGRLVKRFDNDDGTYGGEGFTYEEHVTPFVESLLERTRE